VHRLTDKAASDFAMEWAPNGKKIAFTSNRDAFPQAHTEHTVSYALAQPSQDGDAEPGAPVSSAAYGERVAVGVG
jgi:hypothetical protein